VIEQPTLATERLLLRPFHSTDAPQVQALAGDARVAEMTATIPHPYPDGAAGQWIAGLAEGWSGRTLATFAVILRESGDLIGCVSLMDSSDSQAEIGYWIGVPYWNQGYCSEAVDALIGFGITSWNLTLFHARHLSRNPASGKVLKNAGLRRIGKDTITWRDGVSEESIELYELNLADDG
jgi:[ribosomal protein S5]-alanine N-acetyltransferase